VKKAKNIDIGISDFAKLVKFAQENDINLVVPGPEVPLVGGIESWFRKGMCLFSCLIASRHSLFWTNGEGRPNGRVKDLCKRFHVSTQYPNCTITSRQHVFTDW